MTTPNPPHLPLVGPIEIAMRAGVKYGTVHKWRERHPDFPQPVCDLASGPIFWWPAVSEWLRRTNRRTDAGWTHEQVAQYYKVTHPPGLKERETLP